MLLYLAKIYPRSGGMLYASILITIGLLPQAVEAAVACNETHNPCEVLLWKGSKCLDGFCTNPFQGGCLRAILDNEEYDGKYSSDGDANNALSMQALRRRLLSRPRVCNSEDGPDALGEPQLNSKEWSHGFFRREGGGRGKTLLGLYLWNLTNPM